MDRKLVTGSWISDSGVFCEQVGAIREGRNRPNNTELMDHNNPKTPAEWIWRRTWELHSLLLQQLNAHGTKYDSKNKQAILQQLFALEEVLRFCRQEVQVEQKLKEPDEIMWEEHKRGKQWQGNKKTWK